MTKKKLPMITKSRFKSSPKLPPAPTFQHTAFWQELFIYFWVFSLVGHFLELLWAPIDAALTGNPLWHPTTYTILPLAPPYGLGAVAIILIILPLIRKHRLHIIGAFFLSVVTTAVVEYLCATVLIWVMGSNIFWDYSHHPFNFQGRICLENCLLFGLAATFFLYVIYPFCEKILRRLTDRQLRKIFWILFSIYTLDWLMVILNGTHYISPHTAS